MLEAIKIISHSSLPQLHILIKIPSRIAACLDLLLGILIFKGLTTRRVYKSFGDKGLCYKREGREATAGFIKEKLIPKM
jgi:hypothetical protein